MFSTFHRPDNLVPYLHGRAEIGHAMEDCVMVTNLRGNLSREVLLNGVWDESVILADGIDLPMAIRSADFIARQEAMR